MTSPEFFINMKSIPDEGSQEYEAFFENERKKIDYGVVINGVFIHGWLYWHLNFWNIYLDIEDPINHSIRRKFQHPQARDNEWLIAEGLKGAEENKEGLLVFGSRRLGKSVYLSSYIGRHATIYEGSENIVSGNNWPDVDVITSNIEKGLASLHPFFRFTRLGDNWRKEVPLGLKDKKGNRYEWSKILVRNFDGGSNPEAVAGVTASSFVFDECGKADWLESFDSAKPAFTSPYGWRCVPIVTGTSGMLKPNTDAQKVFENPKAYNFRAFELKEERKVVAMFIPGTRRMEAKFETTMGDFVQTQGGILIPKTSELFTIPMWDSNLKLGEKIIDEEIKQAQLSPDQTAVLKARMYYPKNTTDLFLSEEDNQFPIEAINELLNYLDQNKDNEEIVGWPVRLFRDSSGKVRHKAEDRNKVIMDFPVKQDTNKDAPIVIYEFPMDNPPPFLFISSADPYNQSETKQSTSLGTCHVYKRMYDPVAGTYQNSIVASYAARPKTMREWHENVELLMEFYNATMMPENEAGTFIQYFDQKNKGHLLADGYSMLKEITPNTSITGRTKGLPATKGVIAFCMNLLYQYTTEEIQIGTHPETKEPIKKLGVWRIKDRMLLMEMLNYKQGGNFDRIVSFRHALAYDNKLTKDIPVVHVDDGEPKKLSPSVIKSPFALGMGNPFAIRQSKPFR